MYIGMLGIVHAVRKPATILTLESGSLVSRMYDERLFATADITIGALTIPNARLLFDTGATESVVYVTDAVRRIGAEPYDTGVVRMADGSLADVLYYESVVSFPCGIRLSTDLIDVMEADVSFADMVVGMDIISKGTLTVYGKEKRFAFTM